MQEACRSGANPARGRGDAMAFSQRLEMRQGQALVMTPQLLQAIKLLQLSHLDLAAYVDAELERNPLLDRPEEEAGAAGDAPDAGRDDGPDDGDGNEAGDMDGAVSEPMAATWLPGARAASRAEIEGELDTNFDSVFPADATEIAAPPGGDSVSLTPSP